MKRITMEDLLIMSLFGNRIKKEYASLEINRRSRRELQMGKMKIVGVANKQMRDFCYYVNNIRPLHLAQSLGCNHANLRAAIKYEDKDWKEQLIKERIELYKEAKEAFGISMEQLNRFAWLEFKHDIDNFKELRLTGHDDEEEYDQDIDDEEEDIDLEMLLADLDDEDLEDPDDYLEDNNDIDLDRIS